MVYFFPILTATTALMIAKLVVPLPQLSWLVVFAPMLFMAALVVAGAIVILFLMANSGGKGGWWE